MCNRYQLKGSAAEVAAALGMPVGGVNWPEEMFPARPGLVGTVSGARLMDWGWPPPGDGKGRPVTNARNLDSPFWRAAVADPARRCLIPASRFCEWEGAVGAKRARWFGVREAAVFVFAGVWRPHGDGAVYAMLTCAPNALVGAVHPKAMPVILAQDAAARWLREDWAAARAMVRPFADEAMWIE
ncbi:MAG: SOS response-associated peptidase [Polymorphobacter sp.]|uniref:SOS response-associated peptidase n=1 Tax=Polymorphobacter sp. TaxID=1909290 RepID=UPI003A8BA887